MGPRYEYWIEENMLLFTQISVVSQSQENAWVVSVLFYYKAPNFILNVEVTIKYKIISGQQIQLRKINKMDKDDN